MNASKSGQFKIGGKLKVNRLGFGAMRITGEGIWGQPKDKDEAVRVLKRAVELGVNLIDTADAYGPYVSEELIAEALYPYPEGLVIATKAGLVRSGPGVWNVNGKPEHIREAIEGSLKRLKLESINLYQLHRIDPAVSLEDTIAVFVELLREGKIKHFGLSEVSVDDIKKVSGMIKVDTVQNIYNFTERKHEDVLDYCEASDIGFIPWNPLAIGNVSSNTQLMRLSEQYKVTPAQLALAWLLKRSPVMLPIPGTSSVKHLEENIAAADIEISDKDFAALNE
jgi:aryl-alcohol dehydrogenase-like predicted oxidoreductase